MGKKKKGIKALILNGYKTFEEASADSKYTSKTEALLHMLNGENCFISGPAGSGKSYLISMFIEAMKIIHPEKNITLTSTTGLSAINIGGITIHKFIGLLGNRTFTDCFEDAKCKYHYWKIGRPLIQQTDILIIDEISMLSKRGLDFVFNRLQLEDKSNIQVIVLGDFTQLPPVNTSRDQKDKDASELCYGTEPWIKFGFKDFYLDKIYRTADVSLSKLLDNISLGVGNSTDSKKIIDLIKAQPHSEVDKNTSVLMSTNRAVDAYNTNKQSLNKNKLFIFPTLYGAKKVRFEAAKKDDLDFAKLVNTPENLQLKTGDTVMITSNQVDYTTSFDYDENCIPKTPLQNGSIGILEIVEHGGTATLNLKVGNTIYCNIKLLTTQQMENTKQKTISPSMNTFISEYNLDKKEYLANPKDFLEDYWDLISIAIENGSISEDDLYPKITTEKKVAAQFTQYPIKLAYAISIHKSQGQTFKNIAVDMGSMWMENLGYVALSRAQTLDSITFINKKSCDIPAIALSVNKRSLEIKNQLLQNTLKSKKDDYDTLKSQYTELIKEYSPTKKAKK